MILGPELVSNRQLYTTENVPQSCPPLREWSYCADLGVLAGLNCGFATPPQIRVVRIK
jgi:hypothetical protein